MRSWFLVSFQLLDEKGVLWKESYKTHSLKKALEIIEETRNLYGFTLIGLDVKYPYFGDNEKVLIYG